MSKTPTAMPSPDRREDRRYTITLGAATLEELAQLVALVHRGLRSENPAMVRPARAQAGRDVPYRWTAADEAVLTQMKTGNAPWSEIAAALGRTEKAVGQRWQAMRPRP